MAVPARREITQSIVWLARTPGCGDLCSDRFGHHAETHERYGAEQERLSRAPAVVRTGVLTLDLAMARALVDGRDIHLTGRPLSLLSLLAARVGEVVPYAEIISTIWGAEWHATPEAGRHNLSVTRTRLRSVLGAASPLLVTRIDYGMGLLNLPPGDMSGVAEQASNMSTRWAKWWDACRECGTTARSHEGWGYCGSCVDRERRRRRLGFES